MNATTYYQRKFSGGSKYHAQRTVVDGRTFVSRKEANRYRELLLLGLAGELTDLELQPRFPLSVNGVSLGAYLGDFAYRTKDGRYVVEDVKSPMTRTLPIYRWKIKHLHAQYGIRVEEV